MTNPNPAAAAASMPVSMGTLITSTPSARSPSNKPHLTVADFREMANAMLFARKAGRAWNRHITVWWKHSEGFSEDPRSWIAHQGKLLKAIGAWMDHRGLPTSFGWTREVGEVKGPHSHILCHIPACQVEAFQDFIVQSGKFATCPAGIDNRPIVISGGWPWEETGAETPAQQAALLRYACKDISPVARVGGVLFKDALAIRPEANSGAVLGKRCGVHRSLGYAARQNAGWNEVTSLDALRAALPTGEDARRERRRKTLALQEASHV